MRNPAAAATLSIHQLHHSQGARQPQCFAVTAIAKCLLGTILDRHALKLGAGEAEALALDKNRKPVLDMHSQVTEERVCDGPLDYVTRCVMSASRFLLVQV